MNPVPADLKPRVLSTAIDLDDSTASLELAMDVAPYFELKPAQAEEIAAQVAAAAVAWRAEAKGLGLSAAEMDRAASAFEHEDSRATVRTSRGRRFV